MKILIISATDMEIAPFRAFWVSGPGPQSKKLEISFLTTGIGMLATASRLSAELTRTSYDLIIQAGIAGCFDNNTPLGTVYRVSQDRIADLGVEEDHVWKDVFDMGLVGNDEKPFTGSVLPGKPERMDQPDESLPMFRLPEANAITVNEISTRRERIEQLKTKYNPLLESMEGAALHFTAAEHGVTFVQIRAVSNYIGERNKANWEFKKSVTNLNNELTSWIQTSGIRQ